MVGYSRFMYHVTWNAKFVLIKACIDATADNVSQIIFCHSLSIHVAEIGSSSMLLAQKVVKPSKGTISLSVIMTVQK